MTTADEPKKTPETFDQRLHRELRAQFHSRYIHWRVGSTSHRTKKVQLLAYLDARAVQMRLDDVCGPTGWKVGYEPAPKGGVMATLSIRDEQGRWVSKQDVADNTDFEGIKGGASGAFKRAAVVWGIGRYLYALDAPWVPVQERGDIRVWHKDKSGDVLEGYCTPPALPKWALPEEQR